MIETADYRKIKSDEISITSKYQGIRSADYSEDGNQRTYQLLIESVCTDQVIITKNLYISVSLSLKVYDQATGIICTPRLIFQRVFLTTTLTQTISTYCRVPILRFDQKATQSSSQSFSSAPVQKTFSPLPSGSPNQYVSRQNLHSRLPN